MSGIRARFWLSWGSALGVAIALWPATALARTCRAAPLAPPSRDLIPFEVEEFNLTFEIPNNYRSILRSSGHITFHDPAVFELIQCLVRTGEYREIPPYTALEVHRGVNADVDIVELIRLKRPWLDFYNPSYEAAEFAGSQAIRYDYTNELYGMAIANISFLSDDGTTLLTLTGPADHPIMVDALSGVETASPLLEEAADVPQPAPKSHLP